MARGRILSCSLSHSEKRAALHQKAPKLAEFCQALYPLLIVHADDFGRLAGDPFSVKHAIDPTSPRTISEFSAALKALHTVKLVTWYVVDGRKYLEISQFEEHQQGLHKRTRSRFPEIPGKSRKVPEIPSEEKRTEEKRSDLDQNQDQEQSLRDNSSRRNGHKVKNSNPKALFIMAKVVLKEFPGEPLSEHSALLKERAARAGIEYDAGLIAKALESAEHQGRARK